MKARIGGSVRGVSQADRDGLMAVLAATRVLKRLSSHPEEPRARCRRLRRYVIKTAPCHEHDVPDHILRVGGVHPSAYEAKQVNVCRVIDAPEALLTLP